MLDAYCFLVCMWCPSVLFYFGRVEGKCAFSVIWKFAIEGMLDAQIKGRKNCFTMRRSLRFRFFFSLNFQVFLTARHFSY